MNLDNLDSNVAKEVLSIILFSTSDITDKIPNDLFQILSSKAADSNIEVKFDKDIPLDNQNISSEALDIFAMIYYMYVADNLEKDNILSSWIYNEEQNS